MQIRKPILLATKNINKFREFKLLLPDLNLISLLDLDTKFDNVIEDKTTYLGNALTKAKYYAKKYNLITLADDSGLEVAALNKAPGILSARYSNGGDLKNNLKLLQQLENIENKEAEFICVLVLYFPNESYYSFQGNLKGKIANKIYRGSGFAYDEIFIPENESLTLSKLGDDYKMTHSHRYQATKRLKEFLNENIDNFWSSRSSLLFR